MLQNEITSFHTHLPFPTALHMTHQHRMRSEQPPPTSLSPNPDNDKVTMSLPTHCHPQSTNITAHPTITHHQQGHHVTAHHCHPQLTATLTTIIDSTTTMMVDRVPCSKAWFIDEYCKLHHNFTSRSTLYLLVYTHVKPVETDY